MNGQTATIVVENLYKSFGKIRALDGVDLIAKEGTILGLLGPNGAGKTTLIRILATLLTPDAGRATVAGFDVIRDAQALRSHIGLAGQYAAVDENLTGKENLELVGRLYHIGRSESRHRAESLLERFELAEAAKRLVKTYSGGMRRRLDLAASLLGRPKVLFLDEPTTGLDPPARISLWRIIKELVSGGTTLLLTTQHMEEADQLADIIVVIDRGHIIARGTSNELKSRVGGDVLELHVSDRSQSQTAGRLLLGLGAQPQIDIESGSVALPVKDGTSVLVEAVRRLDRSQVKISDIILRHPTLDDVFLAFTGHAAEASLSPPQTQQKVQQSQESILWERKG